MARRRSQGTAAPRRRQSQPPANKAMPDSSRGVCPAFFRPVRAGILLPSPARDRPCPMPVWRPLSPPPGSSLSARRPRTNRPRAAIRSVRRAASAQFLRRLRRQAQPPCARKTCPIPCVGFARLVSRPVRAAAMPPSPARGSPTPRAGFARLFPRPSPARGRPTRLVFRPREQGHARFLARGLPGFFPSRARRHLAAVPGAGPPLPHAGMEAAFPAATARQPAPRAPPIPGASPSPAIARGRRPPAPTDGPACGGSLPQPISPAWAAKPCKAVEKTSRRFFETRRQAAPIEARVPVFVRRMRLRRLPGAPQSRRAHKNQNPGAARQRAAPGQARYRAGLSSSRSGSRRTPSDARRPGTPRAPWAPRR